MTRATDVTAGRCGGSQKEAAPSFLSTRKTRIQSESEMGYVSLRGRQKTKRVSLWCGIWRDEEGGLVKLVTGEFTLSSDRLRQKGSSVIVLLVGSSKGSGGGGESPSQKPG